MKTFSVFSKEKKYSKIPYTEEAIAKFTGFAKNEVLGFLNSICLFVSVKHAGENIRISDEINVELVLS